jgi:hypothetical protein
VAVQLVGRPYDEATLLVSRAINSFH